jgi:hypothetical protein
MYVKQQLIDHVKACGFNAYPQGDRIMGSKLGSLASGGDCKENPGGVMITKRFRDMILGDYKAELAKIGEFEHIPGRMGLTEVIMPTDPESFALPKPDLESPIVSVESGKKPDPRLGTVAKLDNQGKRSVWNTKIDKWQPVNVEALLELSRGDDLSLARWANGLLFMIEGTKTYQVYSEIASGRIYGQGSCLQNTKSEVTQIALSGIGGDYDLENAQMSMLYQAAYNAGWTLNGGEPLPTFREYYEHPTKMRQELANDLGVDPKAIKTFLIASAFGATLKGPTARIEFGDQLPIVKRHDFFKALMRDIEYAQKIMLKETPQSRGKIQAVNGKVMSRNNSNGKLAAFLLQAMESVAVKGIERDHDVRLWQHDGAVIAGDVSLDDLSAVSESALEGIKVKWTRKW